MVSYEDELIFKLYENKLSCDKYELFIKNGVKNPTDCAIITVKAIDFNGNPIRNEPIQVSCDKGYFGNVTKNIIPTNNNTVDQILYIHDIKNEDGRKIVYYECNNSIHKNQHLQVTLSNNEHIDFTDIEGYYLDLGPISNNITISSMELTSLKTGGIQYTGSVCDTQFLNGNAKTCNYLTNDEGYFRLLYVPSEWGLCTISSDVNKIQFFVKGFKEIELNNSYFSPFEVDESIRACRLQHIIPQQIIPTSITWTADGASQNIIPSKYRPKVTRYYLGYSNRIVTILQTNGSIGFRTDTQDIFNMGSNDTTLMEWRY